MPIFTQPAPVTLLNVSYDPTRELQLEGTAALTKHWKANAGQDVTIQQNHGPSGCGKTTLRRIVATLSRAIVVGPIAGLELQPVENNQPARHDPPI